MVKKGNNIMLKDKLLDYIEHLKFDKEGYTANYRMQYDDSRMNMAYFFQGRINEVDKVIDELEKIIFDDNNKGGE